MKRISLIMLICIFLLTGCSTSKLQNDSDEKTIENTHSSSISYSPLKIGENQANSIQLFAFLEDEIFEANTPIQVEESKWIEYDVDSNISSLQVGNRNFNIVKNVSKRVNDLGDEWNIFYNEDQTIKIQKELNSASFIIQSIGDISLQDYSFSSLTEQNLILAVQSYIKTYINDINFQNFRYQCSTSVATITDEAAWNETKDGFYISSDNSETITCYQVSFTQYNGEIATENKINVMTDSLGNIENLYYYHYEAPWDQCEVDQVFLNQEIELFLDKYLQSQLQLISYNIKSMTLSCVNNKIALTLSVELTLKNKEYNENFVSLCALVVK